MFPYLPTFDLCTDLAGTFRTFSCIFVVCLVQKLFAKYAPHVAKMPFLFGPPLGQRALLTHRILDCSAVRLLFKPHRSLPADSTMDPLHNDNYAAYDFLTLVPVRIKRSPVDKCLYTRTHRDTWDENLFMPSYLDAGCECLCYKPPAHFAPGLKPFSGCSCLCGGKFTGIPEAHPSICLISISAAIPQWHFT